MIRRRTRHIPASLMGRQRLANARDRCGCLGLGLQAATTLRQYFPEFYSTYVAGAPTTPARMAGVAIATISKVHHNLVEFFDLDYVLDQPIAEVEGVEQAFRYHQMMAEQLVNPVISDDQGFAVLEELWQRWDNLPLALYGVDPTYDEDWEPANDPLLVAVYVMAMDTRWGNPDLVQQALMLIGLGDGRATDQLYDLPRLSAHLDLDNLAERIGGPRGPLLKFILGATDNVFADTSPIAQMDYQGMGIPVPMRWDEDLHAAGEQQRAARLLREEYDYLNDRLIRQPATLAGLAQEIADAARSLGRPCVVATWDDEADAEETTTHDHPTDNDDEEAETLAAAA